MRSHGLVELPVGYGGHDHICWSYAHDDERTDAALAWLREGAEHGCLPVYVGPGGSRRETDRFLCEFRDKGTIEDPLVGRFRPAPRERRGRGIWLAHQLADLVQLRSGPVGTTVRLSFKASA